MVDLKHKIPSEFFNEEVRYEHRITIQKKEIWAVELDLLLEFDRVCKQLGLKYFLDSGTLLGAVRDGRFIPWDDDIDVAMLRNDYDKLNAKAPELFQYPYFFQNTATDPFYYRLHAQLRNSETTGMLIREADKVRFNQGIFIDIFVLDRLAENTEIRKKQIAQVIKCRKLLRQMRYTYDENRAKRWLKVVRALILRCFFSQHDLIESWSTSKKNFDSEYVDLVFFRRNPDRVRHFKKEWYDEQVLISFEGYKFPAPIGYQNVLREYYGYSYMIPKMSHTVHGEIIFDTDHSYKEVIKKLKSEKKCIIGD